MNLLALDTCTENCSAAILFNDAMHTVHEITQRGHSERILSMLDEVLAKAGCQLKNIDCLVFGRGPGSFTGVRVGVAVAQGVAFAHALPVIPVSTLAAVAQAAYLQHGVTHISVAMDARMNEVYHADFIIQDGLAVAVSEEQVLAPELVKLPDNEASWFAAGTGWAVYESQISPAIKERLSGIDSTLLPSADAMLLLAKQQYEQGLQISAEQALPVYLRNNVAKKKGEQ